MKKSEHNSTPNRTKRTIECIVRLQNVLLHILPSHALHAAQLCVRARVGRRHEMVPEHRHKNHTWTILAIQQQKMCHATSAYVLFEEQ
jgi:hypothetical protein